MKKLILIDTSSDIYGFATRRLSAFVNAHSSWVSEILFLSSMRHPLFSQHQTYYTLNNEKIKSILELISNAQVIAFSVMLVGEKVAAQLSEKIKQEYPAKIIIWGGAHTTASGERCLKWADYICVGEGEYSLVEFLKQIENNNFCVNVPGIYQIKNNKIYGSGIRPLEKDLDQLGYPLHGDGCFIFEGNKIMPLNKEKETQFFGGTFHALLTQGCPMRCTYCANSALINYNGEYALVRAYSIKKYLSYLSDLCCKYQITSVIFQDDSFFSLSIHAIKEFSEQWRKLLGLPFTVLGVSPLNFNEKKMDYLLGVGLQRIRVGIQSGSEQIRYDILQRKYSNKLLIQISEIISQKKIPECDYDFILDNPWETWQHKLEGLKLLSYMSKPHILNLFGMTFFEGTELYEKAKTEGYLPEENYLNAINYLSVKSNYINLLYMIYGVFHIPPWLLKLFTPKVVLRKDPSIPSFILAFFKILRYLTVAVKRVFRGDTTNLPYFIVRWMRLFKTPSMIKR